MNRDQLIDLLAKDMPGVQGIMHAAFADMIIKYAPKLDAEAPKPFILGTKRLIDSVWTTRGYFTPEGKVHITYYGRNDNEGYDRERELPTAHLIESLDDHRIVTGISITDRHCPFMEDEERAEWKQYAVANPGHVFGYGA